MAPGRHGAAKSTDVRDFSFVVNPRFRLTETDANGTAHPRLHRDGRRAPPPPSWRGTALIGLSEAFGEYPWPDLVLAEVGAGGGFSMEYPRAIHLTRGKVVDTYVVYHEVAHQWFYAQLGNDQQHRAMAGRGLRRLQRPVPDGHRTGPVLDPADRQQVFAWEAGPTTGGDWSSCDGYFHTVFYGPPSSSTGCARRWATTPSSRQCSEWVAANQPRHDHRAPSALHLQAATDADLEPIYRSYLADLDATLRKPTARASRKVGG